MGVREGSVSYAGSNQRPIEAVPFGYKQTEVGMIPGDWQVTNLGALSRGIYRGASPRPIDDPVWFDGKSNVGWVRISDVTQSGRYLTETTQRLSSKGIQSSRYLSSGALIMSICATVGRPIETRIDVCIHDGFVVFDRPSVEQSFLYHLLKKLEPEWSNKGQTGSQMNLNTGLIKSTQVPLPPSKAEQRAIAEALSDADALIESLEQLIAKKRQIKQGIMQALLTGKQRLPGFGGEWTMVRLGEVAEIDPENLSGDTKADFEFNYIALEDVDHGCLRSHSEQRFASAPSRARRKLRLDDVIVSTVRPNLQSHLHFCIADGRWVCSTGFCVVRCRKGLTHPGYVFFHLFANCVNRQIEALLTGSNYPAINSGDVRALEIPMPEYDEQTAIATILTDMDTELAELEARLAKTRQLKQGMTQELLTGRIRLV
jgi:type I restriction enzyme S subunit